MGYHSSSFVIMLQNDHIIILRNTMILLVRLVIRVKKTRKEKKVKSILLILYLDRFPSMSSFASVMNLVRAVTFWNKCKSNVCNCFLNSVVLNLSYFRIQFFEL